ncbi:IclR family transcriptional regulator [Euzebya sp.]|uniref:IclR family transcriptional regulator n=1 Tax=Euzebya sp. TaxID=1971409 RepID=UPI0035192364
MTDQRDTTSHSRPPPAYPIASVDSALRLLLLFRTRREWRLSDMAHELDVADSTAHRLTAMLEYHGFLSRMPQTKAYRIGPSVLALSRHSVGASELRAVLHPFLTEIVEEEGETVSLGVLEGTDIHYVDAVESDAVLRVGNRTGMRIPAHCTSAGKVLLAELPDDQVRALYPDPSLPTVTARSIDTREALLTEIAATRRNGFATSVAASEDGIASLAVAVRDRGGRAVAAAALAAPLARWQAWDQAAVADRMRRVLEPAADLLVGD